MRTPITLEEAKELVLTAFPLQASEATAHRHVDTSAAGDQLKTQIDQGEQTPAPVPVASDKPTSLLFQRNLKDNFTEISVKSRANRAAIEKFITNNFTSENENYYLNNTDRTLSSEQMENFILFLVRHHYDGRLHQLDFNSPEGLYENYIKPIEAFLSTLRPAALAYQLPNTLEVTAILTLVWQLFPDYTPSVKDYAALTTIAVFIMRNNYYFTLGNAFSKEKFERLQNDLEKIRDDLNTKINTLGFTAENNLLALLTQPTILEKMLFTLGSAASFTVKMAASMAVMQTLLASYSMPIRLLAGIVAGLPMAVDSSFSNVVAIAGRNYGSLELFAQNGIYPPLTTTDSVINTASFARFIAKLADSGLIVYPMALIGGLMFTGVSSRGFSADLQITDINPATIPGGTMGLSGISVLSALMYGYIFTTFSVMQMLGHHLPTKRNLDGLAEFPGIKSVNLHRFAQLLQLQWVGPAFEKLDNLNKTDKAVFAVLGALMTAYGCYQNNSLIAAGGEAMAYLSVTALLAGLNNGKARANVNLMLRYAPAQACLFSAALNTWIVETLYSLIAMIQNNPVDDHAHALPLDNSKNVMIVAGVLVVAYAAAIAQGKTTMRQVESVMQNAAPALKSLIEAGFTKLREKCRGNKESSLTVPVIGYGT